MIPQAGPTALSAVTDFGDLAVLLPIVVGVAAIALWHRQPWHAAIWMVAVGGPLLAIGALKVACLDVCTGPFDIAVKSPSGHAGLSAATYLCLALLLAERSPQMSDAALRWRAGLAALLAVAIAGTRVWLGVHTLPEVLMGLSLAAPGVAAFAWARPRLGEPVRGRLAIISWSIASALVMHGARFPSTAVVERLGALLGVA